MVQSSQVRAEQKRIQASFFKTSAGGEPTREWLRSLDDDDRRKIGSDIQTVEFGWPLGMPTCRPLSDGLFEVRTTLLRGRIARVLFYVDSAEMILLHAFIKKTQRTPPEDLELARKNKRIHQQKKVQLS